MKRLLGAFIVFLAVGFFEANAQGIPALKFDLKKSQKFEDKKLGSERSEEKKFTLPRKILQNTITHYNWQFNATEKLKTILERAVAEKKEDYTKLLPFYNFSTDDTQRDSLELDSVIYKANAGILLHDLRNGWVDDLYLLMGQSYFYKKVYDSAFLTFQYINYAFSPKEKDGYDKTIGSNTNEGGSAFSIATNEKKSLSKKILQRTPVRNESLLWLIRTHIALEEYTEAGSLIDVLKNDPSFPARLASRLNEMQALWFYSQNRYDSAAVHLEKAIEGVSKSELRARWEYLDAQLYELADRPAKATEHFNLAIKYTLDPIMDVYARLNAIRQNKTDAKAIEENIAQLLIMARKDRFTNYRDIIYYSIAKIELETGRKPEAIDYLLKSTKATTEESADPNQHARSFLLLGDLYYEKADYVNAANSYDSVQSTEILEDADLFNARLDMLKSIVNEQRVINRQDSLLKLAALPQKEREDAVKKLARILRKQQGLKEEEPVLSPSGLPINPQAAPASEIFDNNSKAEWYFYNASLKARGVQEFKSKWGNRPNVDNWRRVEAVSQSLQEGQIKTSSDVLEATAQEEEDNGNDISFEGLMSRLPLNEEGLKKSNDSIAFSQVEIGKLLVNGVEDLDGAIKILEENVYRFPGSDRYEEALHLLSYCYNKKGEKAKAASILKKLESTEKGAAYLGKLKQTATIEGPDKVAMTKSYDKIYALFISGKFEEALREKKKADSLFSQNYWTPQLLYIEAIYHVHQREDSIAIAGLQSIIDLFPDAPLTEKAMNLQHVVKRRAEIEDHLKNLQIERPAEEETMVVEEPVVSLPKKEEPKKEEPKKEEPKKEEPKKEEPKKEEPKKEEPKKEEPKKEEPKKEEPKKEEPKKEEPKPIEPKKAEPKPEEPKKEEPKKEEPKPIEPKKAEPKPEEPKKEIVIKTELPHYVLLVMEDMDPVYVTESKNAFSRYLKQRNGSNLIEFQIINLNVKIKLLTIGSYANEKEALSQADQLKKSVMEIVPWLPAANYKFGVISQDQLLKLQDTKDIEGYRKFIRETYPGRF